MGLDGVATRYDYDAAGRTLSRTFAAGHPQSITHRYHWSRAGQLLARTTPEGQTRYHYSGGGQLGKVSQHLPLSDTEWSQQAEQEITFEYDALGRIVAEQGEQGELAWAYDALGNCTALTLPDGRNLKQLYYGSGHLLCIALGNLPVTEFTRDTLHRELSRTQGGLTMRSEYDRLGRLRRRDVFRGDSQRPAPRVWSRRRDFDYGNNLIREERDDNPFSQTLWNYDNAGRLLSQDGAQPGNEQWRWDGAGNPLDRHSSAHVTHNRVTELNGIRWQYDIHGRTTEKDDGQTRWRYRYDGEHRLTEVISEPRDRNKPRTKVSFRYDPLGRRISKTIQQLLQGRPSGNVVTTRFVWEGYRLLQEIHDGTTLTYVYSDSQSYEPLARIDGVESPEIYWFHNAANGMPELLTDGEGQKAWEGINSPWGKLLRESSQRMPVVQQNLRMQGQYLDRETGLHYNLFRYYDPDSGRFTQQDPIGLAGGINLYQYAPNALGWVDPWGLSRCSSGNKDKPDFYVGPAGPSATLPSTGYRYMRYLNDDGTPDRFLDSTLETKSAPITYFGFKKFESGRATRDAFQIKGLDPNNPLDVSWSDGRLRGTFDTLQLYENGVPQAKVPRMFGNKDGAPLEPFTEAYPEYGKGGVQQLIADKKLVLFDEIKILPEE